MFRFRFGGPRWGGGGGILFIFLLMMFLPELISLFLPLLFFGVMVYAGSKFFQTLFNSKNNQTHNTYTNSSFTSTHNSNTQEANTNTISNADLTRIDKKLSTFFKNNVALPVIDDISLVTAGAKYTSIDQLFLTYKDEKIIRLGDFKNDYYGIYSKIVALLGEFSKQSDAVMQQKVDTTNVKEEDKLSDAQKYINKIDELNSAIPQEEITNGLNQTCDLLKQIELSKQSKQDEQKLNKLYDYYLPILTGILENYKTLQDRAIKDDEFKKCEAQLIKTIMLINQALKTLYGEMHEDDYLNIKADMDTLETLIKKDGFDSDPFAKEK